MSSSAGRTVNVIPQQQITLGLASQAARLTLLRPVGDPSPTAEAATFEYYVRRHQFGVSSTPA
jgi:hypothetical protein